MIITGKIRLLNVAVFLALSILTVLSVTAPGTSYAASPAALSNVNVLFKMDTSITRGMYMGDRWISPPVYYVQEGKNVAVEAAAKGLDAQGREVDISPAWKAVDPGMITISPEKGATVMLTIRKEGKSELKVTAAGISTRLLISAWYKNEAMHVEISLSDPK